MKILEVRDGFIKVEINVPVELSSFLLIDSFNKKYIAQVFQIKNAGATSFLYAKILFLYNDFEKLIAYDDTLPSIEANVSIFSQSKLFKDKYGQQILSGEFIEDNTPIYLSKNCFDKNLFVSFENKDSNNIIIENLVKQFIQIGKIIIIDTLGLLKGNKYIAGKDFKLPLNRGSLSFMYEDCLNDATSDSKTLIKEIFQSLSEYSETVPFVPFETLKNIVDDMVDKTHEFRLLVLKNKLAKFQKLGYFATSKEEVANLNDILNSDCAIIDLSKLDSTFLNRYIKVIYNILENLKTKPQVLIGVSNLVDKKGLKAIMTSEVPSTLITHSKFKYTTEIVSMFDNFIIEPSFTNNQNFSKFSTFLKNMQNDNYLVVGKDTFEIPLISKLKPMECTIQIENEVPVEKLSDETVDNQSEDETSEANKIEEEEKISEGNDIELSKEDSAKINEVTPQDIAINAKSDELIEKISSEIDYSDEINNPSLFEEEEDDNNGDDNYDIVDSSDNEFEEIDNVTIQEEFHTQVDSTQTIEVSDEITTLTEEDIDITEEPTVENEEYDIEIASSENNPMIPEENNIVEDNSVDEQYNEYTEITDTDSVDIDNSLEINNLNTDQYSDAEEKDNEEEDNDVAVDDQELAESLNFEDNITSENNNITDSISEEIIDKSDINTNPDEISETVEINTNDEFITDEDIVDNNEIELEQVSGIEQSDFVEETDNIDDTSEEPTVFIDLEEDSDSLLSEEDLTEEDLDKEIVEDVDKVFTTIKEEDSLSDTDLDFIDELNGESQLESIDDNQTIEPSNDSSFEVLEELPEEDDNDSNTLTEFIEDASNKTMDEDNDSQILEKKETSTPIVPVYEADIPEEDIVASDNIEPQDMVSHAKFGNGVVEKMVKYGTKSLYLINFSDCGRKLLDPTLTEIKKV